MTPEERDRLARSEAKIEGLGEKLDGFKVDLNKRLDKQDAVLTKLVGHMERQKGGAAAIMALSSLTSLITGFVAFVGAKSTGLLK